MSVSIDELMTEYRRLWQVFRDTPNNRGPDSPPRQVCFDIQRAEDALKAAGIADPFGLVRDDHDAIARIQAAALHVDDDEVELEDLVAELETPQPAQLSFF